MRILHLTPHVGLRSGGLGPVALGLTRDQRELGHQPAIWCLDPQADVVQACGDWRLSQLESVVTYSVLGPRSLGFSPAMERAAGSALASGYDVLHQQGLWTGSTRATNRWRRAFRRPTVVAPQGMLEEYSLERSRWKKRLASMAYEATNLRAASCLHAASASEVVSFRRYGLTNPIALIPNGIAEEWLDGAGDGGRFRHRFSVPSERRVLLFLSRIHPKKGLPLLLDAMARSRAGLADWVLVVGGVEEQDYLRGYQARVGQLQLGSLVRFVGTLSSLEKRDAFAAADVFVLPTLSENFGIAVAEALGSGVPVLTTRAAPWQELETHRCGWWVDIDVDAMTAGLLDATRRTKEELQAMGERGRRLVAEEYTWSRAAEKTIRLYQWLLKQDDVPPFVLPE